jgi:hypothetical protein
VTEPATLSAGSGEPGGVGRYREVGGRHQLASGCGGQAVYSRDHGLGDRLHRGHQLGARGEEEAQSAEVGAGEVGEVVAGRENRAVAGKDHAPGVAVTGSTERLGELLHQLERQRVPPLGPVHGDRGEALLGLHDHMVGPHGYNANPSSEELSSINRAPCWRTW